MSSVQGFTPDSLLLVALGGAAGPVLRYLVSVAAIALLGPAFPWGALAVNAIGSYVVGAMAGADVERHARLLFVTGLLGAFSTCALEATMPWSRALALSPAISLRAARSVPPSSTSTPLLPARRVLITASICLAGCCSAMVSRSFGRMRASPSATVPGSMQAPGHRHRQAGNMVTVPAMA